MPISYDKLWKMLIDLKMNRTELKNAAGISSNIVAKLGRNEFVSMESLYKICLTLNCNIGANYQKVNREMKKGKEIGSGFIETGKRLPRSSRKSIYRENGQAGCSMKTELFFKRENKTRATFF